MNRTHRFTPTPWLALLLMLRAGLAQPAPYQLAVVTDRPDALYAVGEQVKFAVTLKQDGAPLAAGQVSYVLDKDGLPPMLRGSAKVENGAATIEGTLAEPGFLACRVTFTTPDKKPVTAVAAADRKSGV